MLGSVMKTKQHHMNFQNSIVAILISIVAIFTKIKSFNANYNPKIK